MKLYLLCLSLTSAFAISWGDKSDDGAQGGFLGVHRSENGTSRAKDSSWNASSVFAGGGSAGLMATLNMKAQCNIVGLYKDHPSLCTMGADRFSVQQMKDHIPTFQHEMLIQKQHLPKHCCMGMNHQMAISFLIHQLKPAIIVESGVAAGHGTFLLRLAAGKTTPIYSFDPGDPSVQYPAGSWYGHWKDPSGATQYYTGPYFQDIAAVQWDLIIPDPAVRARTLFILDDHQSCVERFRMLQRWGFKWAFYEDNYPFYVATSNDDFTCKHMGNTYPRTFDVGAYLMGDAYSPNAACGAPIEHVTGKILYKDKFGHACKWITKDEHGHLVKYLQTNMNTYFEFPPLFTTCPTTRTPLMGTDPAVLTPKGFPDVASEIWHYGHLFPAFIELKDGGDPGDPLLKALAAR